MGERACSFLAANLPPNARENCDAQGGEQEAPEEGEHQKSSYAMIRRTISTCRAVWRWLRRLVRWRWFACFLGNYEWYRRLYGGLWARVHVEDPCYSCMWLNCPEDADETYREWNWRGTPEFRNYDPANSQDRAREA